ncbi:guanine deaminase [Zoogloea sp. 1C4]|uniref:guanine deaminase n=1 Tax=Zoogloea sp. 1C4 TaxID=2570190 RepID=UPI001D174493|nr:guanine deaminase [Zoogloea sp. 1C4]
MMAAQHVLVRGQMLHFLSDPGPEADPAAWQYFDDGGLWIVDGRIQGAGPWDAIVPALPPGVRESAAFHDHRGRLVLPGFVDTHLHYAQAGIIGAYGRQLLDWLNEYTFPAEARLADLSEAERAAAFVVERLLAHGTTSASVFGTVHAHSADAFFAVAEAHRLRLLCGKVLMDRNCPDNLRDTAESGIRDSLDLIGRWHGRGRLRYSLTPRFAPTSTPEQLRLAGELFASVPDLHLQTHLAENRAELAWVADLFPDQRSYLDVYAHFGLLGPRAIHAHCIHLDDDERRAMAASGTSAAFCPSSNLFLGSGFFDHAASLDAGLRVGLATDIGAGTGFSLLATLRDAYHVSQTCGTPLGALRGFYLATLGGARALYLDEFIGSFTPGREADFVVLDWAATPELAWRMERTTTLAERLFALMILGDQRCVVATHVLGAVAWRRG